MLGAQEERGAEVSRFGTASEPEKCSLSSLREATYSLEVSASFPANEKAMVVPATRSSCGD